MRVSDVLMVYFVIGGIMVGGGAVPFSDSGVVTHFVDDDSGDIGPAGGAFQTLDNQGGVISSIVAVATGWLTIVWNLLKDLITFIHWPITTLLSVNAPPMAVLLIGGGFTAAFYLSVMQLIAR